MKILLTLLSCLIMVSVFSQEPDYKTFREGDHRISEGGKNTWHRVFRRNDTLYSVRIMQGTVRTNPGKEETQRFDFIITVHIVTNGSKKALWQYAIHDAKHDDIFEMPIDKLLKH